MYRKCVCVAALCLAFAMAGSVGAQTILFEYWDNIGGGTAVSDLTGNALYPDSPTSSAWLEVFQSPSGRADNYGVRARAYLTPPETGDYTFWVAGDDNCQLWLSTDDTAANATMIAQVASWTGVAEWGKEAGQQSAPQSLVAGQAYYIEGLMKEGGGGDSLDVGWAGPGIGDATTIIAGQYCTPFVRLQARSPEPADGAVDWTDPMFKWAPGDTTTICEVYVGTSPELTEANFMGQWPNMYYHLGTLEPGVTYYWRVDGVEADGDKVTGKVWSFTVQPLTAHAPSPQNGALLPGSEPPAALSWTAGQAAVSHDVYFSTDQALVAAGDASVAVSLAQAETTFAIDAASLLPLTTYYWKVDELDAAGVLQAGAVWSFRITDKDSDMNTENWAFGIDSADPKFSATYVADGLYDIGAFGGEMTYEFVVRSNPDEVEASMCLIGRRQFGDTKAGLKYEQWNNTLTYGATLFGVADYDYQVPTAPGEYTHLVFVASTAAGTTDLYVNGEFKGSVPAAITLSGTVGIGYGAQVDAPGYFDNFDGDIFGVAIYDRVLTADEIAANADKYFNPIPITDPDLLIYYDFETGEGTTAVDQSGHSNHGQFFGSPKWVEGLFGGCLSLDIATLDYVQTKVPLNIVSNTVSVSGWVKHDAAPAGWSGILTHRGTSPGNVGLQHDGTELRYMWGADSYWSFSSGLKIPNGEWYFAALTISPTQGKLYLNGVDQTATNVAEHVLTNFDSLVRVGRDHQDSRIMTCLIDEVRFYNRTLTDVEVQKLLVSDVTAPGDVVQGVPNDGDWPGAEHPALAIDNNASTKFLHFKGDIQPSGIQVTPAVGPTIVTGLALTTANDDYGRDPIKYEVYGSNDSIDGPWTLIADGNVVDFSQAALWPRFTTNATAISFTNTVAYEHYQVLFTAVRDLSVATCMQIAEIELLGTLAPLFFEDFESYEAGSDMHGQDGWKGWDNSAGAGAPVSNAQAFSGVNSVEIIGSSDLVHEFDVAGGVVEFSAMQYIPTGSTGTSFFILLNTYHDGGPDDWSVQTQFHLDTGVVEFDGGATATIVYDKWVEVKYVIDLNNNSVKNFYNGVLVTTFQWDNDVHGTLGAVDLYGNSASSVWYDDIVVK
ncbi:MAG: LamG-like jellyroll fold domain-containing protein [Phycisphaerales bacterium]